MIYYNLISLPLSWNDLLWYYFRYLSPLIVLFSVICGGSLVAQSCLTLCDPMDCSLPGFSVYGILQARILDWVTISFSRGTSWPRDQTQVSCSQSPALQANSLPTQPFFLVDCHLLKATLFDLSTKYDVCCMLPHVLLSVTPWTVACQAPLSMEFSQKTYWGGLPFPPLGDLPDPGIELVSPTLQADSLPLNHLGIPKLL